jgi:single-strand DNA-binding protein
MARDFNHFFVSGNLGRDPEKHTSEAGKARVEFSIACNEGYTTPTGDRKEKTTWFNCVAFDSTGEFCYQYLRKGSKVFILGKLDIRKYEAKDGTEKISTKVIITQINLASGSRSTPKGTEEDNEPSIGSYGPDGGPKEDPIAPLPPRSQTERQSPLFDEAGKPIITDDDIPF